jgi:CRP-like cAMP-binding protein
MRNFDWNRYLQQHPVFSDLNNDEIMPLLDQRVSKEKIVTQDQVIVKEGDQDQSIYLIGEGSANVFLKGPNDQDVLLSSMGKGDLIGEMALFEQKKRSATVIATNTCTLLEFNGQEFIKLLHVHPEICFKLLVKLSERLRDLGDHVLNEKLRGVDEKIRHVNAKLDTEIKIIDASLKATQTVFDQTSKRAHEVINSVERSRRAFTFAGTAIGTIFTALFALLGISGYDKVEEVKNVKERAENEFKVFASEMDTYRLKVKGLTEEAKAHRNSIKEKRYLIDQVFSDLDFSSDQIFSKLNVSNRQIKRFLKNSLGTQFHTEMALDTKKATITYDFALSFKDDGVSDTLYRQIVKEILNGTSQTRKSYTNILTSSIDNPHNTLSERQKTLSFYLLLVTFILNKDNNQYEEYLEKFQAALEDIYDPDKETAEVYFRPSIFEKSIYNDTDSTDKSKRAKIDRIHMIWRLIP